MALLLLAVFACQPLQQPRTGAAAKPPDRLASADALMFKGDYDGAERAYASLAASGVRAAHSHLAVLLAYESRFADAVAEATAGVQSQPDSANLARLTRAYDWAGDVAPALDTGARSVKAAAVDPLAHVYYSEALSDAGRYSDAERELKAAASTVKDAYARAELNREWGNYYRGKGDAQQALNYIQLAQKVQPDFPERTIELARFDYARKKPDVARSLLEKVRTGRASAAVLVAAGDAASLGGDPAEASTIYTTALAVQPGSPSATLGMAELDVAQKRDFEAAHTRLLEALKAAPKAGDVYLFLRYLDLLVLKRDPDAELKPIAGDLPEKLRSHRAAALDRVNGYRSSVGLPAVREDGAIAEAAEAHSYYWIFNFNQPQVAGLGIHSEDPDLPGFTGADSLQRDRHFGYPGTRGAEVINHVFVPTAAVQVWADSVFHRFPILDRDTQVAGYGEAQVGGMTIQTIDFGVGAGARGDAVAYPFPNQTGVQSTFMGNELPDPAPKGTEYPIGYPITVQFPDGAQLSVLVGKLIGPDGKDVPSIVLNPGEKVGPNEWSLLAMKPLQPGATYTVQLAGRVDGQEFDKKWSFSVAAA